MRTLSILSIIVALTGFSACKLDVEKEDPNEETGDAGTDPTDKPEPPTTEPDPDYAGSGAAGYAGGAAGAAGKPAAGSGGTVDPDPDPKSDKELRDPSKGSAVALSEDDSIAVVANRG